jgi:hypothetical protein
MIHALQPLNPEAAPEAAQSELSAAQRNPAVAECCEACHRVYQSVIQKRKGNEIARATANMAYRQAMPPPVGYNDICYFIACVLYGMLTGIFENSDGPKLLYGAQVALSTIAPQAKSQHRPNPKAEYPLPREAKVVDIK